MKAFLFARVSTEEQKDAGNSLPAQTERMRTYCNRHNFKIEEEYSFDESAYKEKRDEFDKLLDELGEHSEKIAVCFDKVDRLSRNVFDKRVGQLYDKALLDEIELHFVSDGQVINASISAVEKFHFGISLGLAKYYSDAISDNTNRGFEIKRMRGEWTGASPFGYQSVMIDPIKRIRGDIVPDPLNASVVLEIFEMYASGKHSVPTITKYLNDKNIKTRSGKDFKTSAVHHILQNTFYYGKAYSRKYDIYYDHKYEPLITKELFDVVKALREKRNQNPTHKKLKTTNPFADLLKCKICGCSVCREIKRGKPYHACSNAKKAHKREYSQEVVLLEQIKPIFKSLVLNDEQIEQIVEHLRENHEYKARFYKQETLKLNNRFEKLQRQKDRLLDLLLNESITQPDYDRKLEKITDEQQSINIDRTSLTEADHKYHITAKQTLELARRAGELFERANDAEKNELLKLVLSNATLNGKKLEFSIRKPFDTIVNVKGFPVLLQGIENVRMYFLTGQVVKFEDYVASKKDSV